MNNKNIFKYVFPIALSACLAMVSSISFAADTKDQLKIKQPKLDPVFKKQYISPSIGRDIKKEDAKNSGLGKTKKKNDSTGRSRAVQIRPSGVGLTGKSPSIGGINIDAVGNLNKRIPEAQPFSRYPEKVRRCMFEYPVIQSFRTLNRSCTVSHDPSRALLSYRVSSSTAGVKIARVKIVHNSQSGSQRVVYDRSAPADNAWSTASESGIRDPGPVNGPSAWGKFRLIATSTCGNTAFRDIVYSYRLPLRFAIAPSVQEIPTGSGSWRYQVEVLQAENVNEIKFKYPPSQTTYSCLYDCDWRPGRRGSYAFVTTEKLSERGVTRVYYQAGTLLPSGGSICAEKATQSAELIPDTAPPPTPSTPEPVAPSPAAEDGRWWNVECECSDTYRWANVNVRVCLGGAAGTMANDIGAGTTCGLLGNRIRKTCSRKVLDGVLVPLRRLPGEETCNPRSGNFTVMP